MSASQVITVEQLAGQYTKGKTCGRGNHKFLKNQGGNYVCAKCGLKMGKRAFRQ